MRDLILILFIVGMLPVIIFRPYIGLLLWAWIGYMNPHRLTWSFAYHFRFNLLIAITTILGILYTTRFQIKIPWKAPIVFLFLFTIWTLVTSHYAFRTGAAAEQSTIFLKIQFMIIATLILVKTRRHIISLITVIALSIGFYGLKGGIFTLTSGGQFRVMGPAQSFFVDNNALALALIMAVPLLYFLQLHFKYRLLRLALACISLFSLISILGSYSRGGFVGLAILGSAFFLKTRKKLIFLLTISTLGSSIFWFMPEKWHDRMNLVTKSAMEFIHGTQPSQKGSQRPQDRSHSQSTYANKQAEPLAFIDQETEIMQDKSVSGRMDAWRLAILVANDRPFLGGGYGVFEQTTFDKYTPGVYRHDAHSNFFEVIGEQGYFGFVLWLLVHLSALSSGQWTSRHTRHEPNLLWVRDLAGMLQVGLIGYYAAGSFLGMAYFDLPYHLISILVILRVYTENYLTKQQPVQPIQQTKWPYRPK